MPWLSLLFWLYAALCLIFGIAYFIIQFNIRQTWIRLPVVSQKKSFVPGKKYSVIIAARNEAEHIEACLSSILQSDYSEVNLEVLLLNDHSTDATAQLAEAIKDPRLKIHSLTEGSGKKAAIAQGIARATGDWIITSDADCRWSPAVLPLLAQQAEAHDYKFIAGPVGIADDHSWLARFQGIDVIGTMGVTAAGIASKNTYLANGAHLAYPKAIFEEVGGFSGIDQQASGDDLLLLHKIASKYPDQIHFLKNQEALVLTKAERSFADFFRQRLRWASKGNAFTHNRTWWTMVIVYCNSGLLLSSIFLSLIGWERLLPITAFLFVNKWTADALVLQPLSIFFNKRLKTLQLISGSLFHAVYVFVIGTMAQFTKTYSWKGRVTR